jgi:hypothetical protein
MLGAHESLAEDYEDEERGTVHVGIFSELEAMGKGTHRKNTNKGLPPASGLSSVGK